MDISWMGSDGSLGRIDVLALRDVNIPIQLATYVVFGGRTLVGTPGNEQVHRSTERIGSHQSLTCPGDRTFVDQTAFSCVLTRHGDTLTLVGHLFIRTINEAKFHIQSTSRLALIPRTSTFRQSDVGCSHTIDPLPHFHESV